jgi:ubiquinone/menaquinone biosynthesis C-methylase UbiE
MYVLRKARAAGLRNALRLNFLTAAAEWIPLQTASVTHILAGSVFGFFQNRAQVLDECARVLRPHGYLCTCTFYYTRTAPAALLDGLHKAVGFRPQPQWTRKFWQEFFRRRFQLVSSRRGTLPIHTPEELAASSHSIVMSSPELVQSSEEAKLAAARRLLFYRLLFNEHRRYQGYVSQVWQSK